eukprot:scaffold121129_cov33-Phaeocystis_antarctica.AAC.1
MLRRGRLAARGEGRTASYPGSGGCTNWEGGALGPGVAVPAWSKAGKWAALEAARSSTRGSGWALSGSASSWECRAAQSRQARPKEAQGPSWGAAKGGAR